MYDYIFIIKFLTLAYLIIYLKKQDDNHQLHSLHNLSIKIRAHTNRLTFILKSWYNKLLIFSIKFNFINSIIFYLLTDFLLILYKHFTIQIKQIFFLYFVQKYHYYPSTLFELIIIYFWKLNSSNAQAKILLFFYLCNIMNQHLFLQYFILTFFHNLLKLIFRVNY